MMDYKASCKSVLKEVRSIVLLEDVSTHHPDTVDREVVKLLGLAWAEAVRAEWQAFVDADPELKAQHAVALELMREDGYGEDRMPDPICMMPPGTKAFIVRFDNQETVAVDSCMAQVTPFSALYTDRVRLVQSAAARVAKAMAEEAAKEDPKGGWPIKTAAGEVFNSIEDMKASPNEFVRGLAESIVKAQKEREKAAAQMMIDAGMFACHPGFEVAESHTEKIIREGLPIVGAVNERIQRESKAEERAFLDALLPEPQPTCWQYFGFDGPVQFNALAHIYRNKVNAIPPSGADNARLAAEAHQQYQNCLKDLANMAAGPAVTIGDDDAS